MLAKRLEIEQILGVEKLVIEPGAVTIIEGRNASGKTSILEAARALLRGGHDPSLLRHGAEEGRIRLTLSDGTMFLKRVTKERSSLEVTEPQKGRISRAQAYVDSQVDALGIDPMAIVTCPPSKRAEYLAEAMPLKVEPDVFEAIIGRRPTAREAAGNALDLLASERQRLYDERTAVNRTLKDKRTTAAQLRETLPAAAEVPADVEDLRAKRSSIFNTRTEDETVAREIRDRELAQIEATRTSATAKKKQWAEGEIEKIRAELASMLEESEAIARTQCDEARTRHEEARACIVRDVEPKLAALSEDITKGEEREKEYVRASKTREIIASSEKDAARAEAGSKALSHAIDELDALKVSLLEKLPIKGLEIREGQVLVDGVPFERVNRARQIEIAVKVAQLRAGNIGLIVVDDTEHLDSESFAAFEAAAAGAGLQFLAARVSDRDLSVRTVEAPAAS